MKAGRELNILVAEKVMHLEVAKNKSGSKMGGYYYTIGEPVWHDIQGDMQLANPVPPYSTDIAAAWQVVEKLYWLNKNEPTILQIYGPLCDGYEVDVILEHHDGPIPVGSVIKESAPHAICLAALKAVGVIP